MKFNSLSSAYIAVFSANIIYGINFALAKGIMPDFMLPRAIIFTRVTGAFLLFLLFFIIFVREKVEKKDIPLFILSALFGISINQTMFFEGLNLTTSINSSIIMTLIPILVLVFSAIILKDKITLLKTIGITAGASGAAWLILENGDLSFSSDTFTGNIYIVINAASFAYYLVISKPLIVKYHPVTVMTWVFGIGLIIVTPFTITPFMNTDFQAIPVNIWFSLGYVVVFSTFLGYLLYNLAIRKLSPTATSTFIYLQPLFAGVVAFFLLDERPGWIHLAASLIIVAGVYLVNIQYGKKTTVQ